MAPPPQNPIKGVQGLGPGVRHQTAMKVHVTAYQRDFRPRGKGRAWEDRTEKSKQKTLQRINEYQPSKMDRDIAAANAQSALAIARRAATMR